ncbi:uncharacterized protein C8Q71DRAFT_728108 [Rhodofomes roseus]|uniref:Uncharacterized protein n=1 Tax=Rhodofomes roseus TaxID=34475 RepID=A0ABQ8JYH4_9APHY|nr:uncharacterized protein C8Q71DRAFT_728108 [Rhodofomes roseus]KAH9829356.1 hypothetical protein C8Q71DRAFT_728108 [Rhodofomes roseus]
MNSVSAASIISMSSSALYTTFFPFLHAEPILLPSCPPTRAVFVSATLVGARILARRLNVPLQTTERPTLRIVLGRWLGYTEARGQPCELDTDKLKDGLKNVVDVGLTAEEMIKDSGLDEKTSYEVYSSWVEVSEDSLRVTEFCAACLRAADTA